jgi:hypothetical protein
LHQIKLEFVKPASGVSVVDKISNSSSETIPETLQSELREKAESVRIDFLKRAFPSGNVSVAKAQLASGMEVCKEHRNVIALRLFLNQSLKVEYLNQVSILTLSE